MMDKSIPGEAIVGISVNKDDGYGWWVGYERASGTSDIVREEYQHLSLGSAINKAGEAAAKLGLPFSPTRDFVEAGFIIITPAGIWEEVFPTHDEASAVYRRIQANYRDLMIVGLWKPK